MKIRKSILTAGAGVLLAAFSGMALANPNPQKQPASSTKQAVPKPSSKPTSSVSQGTITSIDSDRMVMSHKLKNGKTEELTFMLNAKTERKGDLKPGANVNVHYKNENNQLTATAVQATSKSTTAKKTTAKS